MEQKPKITMPLWRLVATYYLTSVFSLPLIGYILAVAVIMMLNLPVVASAALIFVASLITAWFGAGYGARFVQKRYEIPNPKKLVKYAVITLVVLQAIGIVLSIIALANTSSMGGPLVPLLTQVAQSVLVIGVFYFASRKYLLGGTAG